MSKYPVFSQRINPQFVEHLREMATKDLRTLSGQLEWLIRSEWARRKRAERETGEATPVGYSELPAHLDKVAIAKRKAGQIAPGGGSDE